MQFCTCKFWLPFIVLVSVVFLLLGRLQCLGFNLIYFRNFYYENERKAIINHEQWQQFGRSLVLNSDEERANQRLMHLKMLEYVKWDNDTFMELTGDVTKMREILQKSLLYRLLKRMPKGGALHLHDKALTNPSFLVELMHEKDLWLCVHSVTNDYELLKFSVEQPNETDEYRNITCNWHLLEDLRKNPEEIDIKLIKSITLSSLDKKPKEKLKKIEQLLEGFLTYAPVWQKYLTQAFEEFYMDNVQYLEIRSSLPRLYDLDGNYYANGDALEMMRKTSINASQDISFFYGSSFIYSLPKNVNDTKFEMGLRKAMLLKLIYPDYFIGIDLVDEPNIGRHSRFLKEFSYRLLEMQDLFDYYLTVAETNWHDDSTFENILESYLLGTKRMLFTKALLLHPYILSKLVYKNIPIIINPIADQIFHRMEDLANHPASILFRHNIPLIISSDYPAYWSVDPLTFDYYNVFMKMAPKQADLKFLKQLSLNSINYSGLEKRKKAELLKSWQYLWRNWICQINHIIY